MKQPFADALETIRDGTKFTLYRGRQQDAPVLVVAPAGEPPKHQSLRIHVGPLRRDPKSFQPGSGAFAIHALHAGLWRPGKLPHGAGPFGTG